MKRSTDQPSTMKEKSERINYFGERNISMDKKDSTFSQKPIELSKLRNYSSKSGLYTLLTKGKPIIKMQIKPMSSQNMIRVGSADKLKLKDKNKFKTFGNSAKEKAPGNMNNDISNAMKSGQFIPSFDNTSQVFSKNPNRQSQHSLKLNDILLENNYKTRISIEKPLIPRSSHNFINSRQFLFM
jgi:hypothetical protein